MIQRRFRCAVVLAVCMTLPACLQPAPSGILAISWVQQTELWYCVPASIVAWSQYDGSTSNLTQDHVWNWVQNVYPQYITGAFWPGGGMTPHGGAKAAQQFIDWDIDVFQYTGPNRIIQAVADQKKGIESGQPTIVGVNRGTHAVLVKALIGTASTMQFNAQVMSGSGFLIRRLLIRAAAKEYTRQDSLRMS